jgi:hypothetical protein
MFAKTTYNLEWREHLPSCSSIFEVFVRNFICSGFFLRVNGGGENPPPEFHSFIQSFCPKPAWKDYMIVVIVTIVSIHESVVYTRRNRASG